MSLISAAIASEYWDERGKADTLYAHLQGAAPMAHLSLRLVRLSDVWSPQVIIRLVILEHGYTACQIRRVFLGNS